MGSMSPSVSPARSHYKQESKNFFSGFSLFKKIESSEANNCPDTESEGKASVKASHAQPSTKMAIEIPEQRERKESNKSFKTKPQEKVLTIKVNKRRMKLVSSTKKLPEGVCSLKKVNIGSFPKFTAQNPNVPSCMTLISNNPHASMMNSACNQSCRSITKDQKNRHWVNSQMSQRGENSVRHSQASKTVNAEGTPKINHYELLNRIGRGSFGEVMRARHAISKQYFVVFPHPGNQDH